MAALGEGIVEASSSLSSLLEQSQSLELAGDVGQAIKLARLALAEADALGEPALRARALYRLGKLQFRLGHYAQAQSFARQALLLAPPQALARAEAWLLLGNCAAETNSLTEAEGCFQQAIDLSREIGCQPVRFRALQAQAIAVHWPRGQFDLALAGEQEAAQIARQEKMAEEMWFPLNGMGWVYWITGRRAEAYRALEEVKGVVSSGSLGAGYCDCLHAHLAFDDGLVDRAESLFRRARSVAEALGEPGLVVLARLGLSRCRRASGETRAALDWADEAVAAAARVGYEHFRGLALIERARARWAAGDLSTAEVDLRAALEALARLGARHDEAHALLLLAGLLRERGAAQAHETWAAAVAAILAGDYAFLVERERRLAYPLIASSLSSRDRVLVEGCTTLLERLQRVPAVPLRITTLGDLRIEQGPRQIDRSMLRPRRAGELLMLVLLSPGGSASFDQIAEALWPESEPALARMSFHHATSTLRQVLEPELPAKLPSRYLEVEGGWVTLHLPAGSVLDYEALAELCGRGEWEEALGLYGGPFLPEYLYANWTAAPRQRLAALYQEALLALGEARMAQERYSEALELAQRALAQEPWEERAVLIGMQACVGLNDRARALRLYRDLERTLEEDLAVAPGQEVEDLYRSLTQPSRRRPRR